MADLDADRIYGQIGHGMISAAPEGWVEVRTAYRKAGKTAEASTTAVMADGAEVGITLPWDAIDGFNKLRTMLYQDGKGAWYTANAVVTQDGKISIDLDYDSEPAWKAGVVPRTYIEDLEMFPREEDARPGWLRERLQQADA